MPLLLKCESNINNNNKIMPYEWGIQNLLNGTDSFTISYCNLTTQLPNLVPNKNAWKRPCESCCRRQSAITSWKFQYPRVADASLGKTCSIWALLWWNFFVTMVRITFYKCISHQQKVIYFFPILCDCELNMECTLVTFRHLITKH